MIKINLQKIREIIFREHPLSYEKFMKITCLVYDKEKFIYYLERIPANQGGNHYHKNRFFEVSSEVVWGAEKRNDLQGLLVEIIAHVEWIEPSFYNLGLHI